MNKEKNNASLCRFNGQGSTIFMSTGIPFVNRCKLDIKEERKLKILDHFIAILKMFQVESPRTDRTKHPTNK